MTTGIGIVVRTAVHVRVHNRHTINDMRVNEEIYLNIIRSKKQQQSHCRYPCDSMFFTFHAAKVQRIFGTAKFLAKKITERTILIKNVQIYLLHFLFIGEGSYLYRLLSRRYYRRIAHLRIGNGFCHRIHGGALGAGAAAFVGHMVQP